MKKALMFLLLVLYSVITFPDTYAADSDVYLTGNELLSNCENDDNYSRGACHGYIIAVSDVSQNKSWDGALYCVPNNATAGQLVKIVTKYLNKHPEKLHLTAHSLVQLALFVAFPCE